MPVLFHRAPGCGAVVILKNGAAARQHRLFLVAVRHLASGIVEILDDPLPAFLVQHQLQPHYLADGFLGQIVFGGTQPAGQHHQIAAFQRLAQQQAEPLRVIAHGGLAQHRDAMCRELARQKLAVGIHNVPQQQLGTHGYNFCLHSLSPRLFPPTREVSQWFCVESPPAPLLPARQCPAPAPPAPAGIAWDGCGDGGG